MTVNKDRFHKMEDDIQWLKDWMEFFIKDFYEADDLSQVSVIQAAMRALPPIEEKPKWVV